MPTFLWFYVVGLGLALAVGFVLYGVVGGYCAPLLQALFGDRAGQLWGRTFRMMLVASALAGGLSVRWYGCHGYTDYERVERDPRAMFEKTTEQVAGAIDSSTTFLLVAANVAVVAYAVIWRRRSRSAAHAPSRPPDQNTPNL